MDIPNNTRNLRGQFLPGISHNKGLWLGLPGRNLGKRWKITKQKIEHRTTTKWV